jgi:SAM-dependent methyltransferase
MKKLKPFDKYEYYLRSVQSPEEDARFLAETYKEIRGKRAQIMSEDFCAAFALSCAWVKGSRNHQAICVDLDPEPIEYGKTHYLPKLSPAEQQRVKLVQADVLSGKLPQTDIIAALNFSYFCFKKRETLKKYFEASLARLKPGGILIVDCFGGPSCFEPNEHETEHRDFSYFWDQDTYNPITHEAMFYIHFKRVGEKKREKVFTYDWRLWTIAELRDIMAEVGFKKSIVYWEGTGKDGDGNGIFTPSEEGEDCEAWIAYIVGAK